MRRLLALMMLVLPIAAGGAVTSRLLAQAEGPARVATIQAGLAVRVALVEAGDFVPVAQGWGTVRPADTWTAVSEVNGTVIWRHPDLRSGRVIGAGETVLRIDPVEYQLAIAQAEADLAALHAEIAQIEAEELNTRRVLALEEARLALSESDVARTRELMAQGTVAQARGDEAERAVLAARRQVVELQNALALIAPRRARTEAQIARTVAALERARRDLAQTEIVTPFELRVTGDPVEEHRFVAAGQTLATGETLDRVEVLAQFPVAAFQRVLAGHQEGADVLDAMRTPPIDAMQVSVAPVDNPGQLWQGRVTRVEPALEARARTVQVVVEVADPISGARPPARIPLVTNMQVEVTLTGAAVAEVIAIPASALHGGQVYLADDRDRLAMQPVVVAFRQGDSAVLAEGLAPGARLVLDDIAPAIPGMPLMPVAP